MAPGVQVDGLKRLRRELRRAGVDMKQFREPGMAAARIVAPAAASGAPRRSGRLAASVRPGATQTGGVVRAGGARLPYAGVINWGWPARGIEGQPFMSDAATATEPQWVQEYTRALDAIMDRLAGS